MVGPVSYQTPCVYLAIKFLARGGLVPRLDSEQESIVRQIFSESNRKLGKDCSLNLARYGYS